MSGWLILKGKKKYFRLKADVLLYFEDVRDRNSTHYTCYKVTLSPCCCQVPTSLTTLQEPRNNVESKLIDSIRLKDAVLTKKEFSFSIKTSDAKLYELAAHSVLVLFLGFFSFRTLLALSTTYHYTFL